MAARSPSRFEDLMRSSGRDVAASRPLLALARADDRVSRAMVEALEGAGLTPSKFNVLMELAASPDARLPLRELGRRLIRSAPNVTELIDRMEADGLVQRERDTGDRRVVLAVLTDQGWDALARAAPAIFEAERALLEDVSRADRRTLTGLLRKLATDENGGNRWK